MSRKTQLEDASWFEKISCKRSDGLSAILILPVPLSLPCSVREQEQSNHRVPLPSSS
jgi:hypothetical protein